MRGFRFHVVLVTPHGDRVVTRASLGVVELELGSPDNGTRTIHIHQPLKSLEYMRIAADAQFATQLVWHRDMIEIPCSINTLRGWKPARLELRPQPD